MRTELSPTTGVGGAGLAFHAMGCNVSVMVNGPQALLARAQSSVDRLERLWSRFIEDSDLNILNRAPGQPRRVDPMTVRLVRAMIGGWVATDGAFDPTVLPSLVALGDEGRSPCASRPRVPCGSTVRGDPGRIHVDAN